MGNLGDWIGVFLIIAVLFGNGGLFGGGRESVTDAVNYAINNQTTQGGLRDIMLSSANNNYETAMLISNQTRDYMQSNYTNQINVVQGFNAIQSALAGISNQLSSCCCDIKSTLLQDKYDSAVRELAKAQNEAVNSAQSAYLLSTMGKWVANPAAAA